MLVRLLCVLCLVVYLSMSGCEQQSGSGSAAAVQPISSGTKSGSESAIEELEPYGSYWSLFPPPCSGGEAVVNSRDGGVAAHGRDKLMLSMPPFSSDKEGLLIWVPDGSEIIFSTVRWETRMSSIIIGSDLSIDRIDKDGKRLRKIASFPTALGFERGIYGDLSSDGARIAYASCEFFADAAVRATADRQESVEGVEGHFYEIGVMNLDGSMGERLTRNHYDDYFPTWSPDGSAIAFLTTPRRPNAVEAHDELRIIPVNGGNVPDVTVGPLRIFSHPPIWSPDGQRVAFLAREAERDAEPAPNWHLYPEDWREWAFHAPGLYTVAPDGSDLRLISETLGGFSWSPDGQRLALVGRHGDEVGLITIAADGSDRQLVTPITVQQANKFRALTGWDQWLDPISWSPDGSRILFPCGAGLCVVGLDGERVTALPVGVVGRRGTRPEAVWSPDGSRIAVVGEFDASTISNDESFRIVLFTMAPDGRNVRFLVGRRGEGDLEAVGPNRAVPVDAAACATGRVVGYPSDNPGLVGDCETLFGLRDRLAGRAVLDWGTHHSFVVWEGVGFGGNPPRIRELELPERRLSGTIPAELGQLAKLERLDLSGNQLTGPIPLELAQLVNLEELFLGGNQLTGCIPPALHSVPDNDLASLGLPDCEPG